LLKNDELIAVIGIGYVGLPIAAAFGNKRQVVGFDIDSQRISELAKGLDRTLELSKVELDKSKFLKFSNDFNDLRKAKVFIVTVPTPVDKSNLPDLSLLKNACFMIGEILKKGDLVIFESTVYPGTTEEICVPILSSISNLKLNIDFFVGYSPERINPGDKDHRLINVIKVVSGSSEVALDLVANLYEQIIDVGVYKAPSIKVAEAAKVIENTQRDLNIALVNELALIFNKLEIDTHDVLSAARTKWNFLNFTPGLVGGHCIGVDPYYLTFKAQSVGFNPEIILAGRNLNDRMHQEVSSLILSKFTNLHKISNVKILVLGMTFKENCPDLRNSKVIDLINTVSQSVEKIDICDPWVDSSQIAELSFGTPVMLDKLLKKAFPTYDAIVLAVSHEKFLKLEGTLRNLLNPGGFIFDLKGFFNKDLVDYRL
jgi:UDP-N-acetyl-D-galactosamine dehydrogenase